MRRPSAVIGLTGKAPSPRLCLACASLSPACWLARREEASREAAQPAGTPELLLLLVAVLVAVLAER